ncbi:MAG: flagellar biosynthesis anti-sigma factor FlgM [Myxococcota bacterium]
MSENQKEPRRLRAEDDEVEELYGIEYLKDCAAGDARLERLEELRRRIDHGAYRVDPETIADELLRRGDLAD